MLQALSDFIHKVTRGETLTIGGTKARWKKVAELTPGMKIAVPNGKVLGHLGRWRGNDLDSSEVEGSDIAWDEIVSIRRLPPERVYDIEVEGTHNFVAGHWIETPMPKTVARLSDEPLRGPPHAKKWFGGIFAHNTTGKALAIFDETGDQNILTASASGVTVANLTRTGDLELKGAGDLRLYDSDNSNYTGFQAPALAANLLMTLPSSAGSSGQVLSTDGSGTLSWAAAGGSSPWSGLTNPTADLALTMAAYTSTFTYNATTGTANLFNLTDTLNNTGTGYLLDLTTASGSTLKPFHVSSAGTEALMVDAAGKVGIGNTSPVGKLDVSGAVTGKALAILNETGDQDILTASASGITRMRLNSGGDLLSQRFMDIANTSYYLDAASTGTSLNTAGQITVAGGTGKIDVGTVDPPYTIDGTRYATYLTAMTGIKEETTGVVETTELVPGVGYRSIIDFGNQPVGSDLWLFSRSTDLSQNINQLVVLLNPEGPTQAWYDLDNANFKLAIYTSRPSRISYRLTAPRFDASRWTNRRDSTEVEGFNLDGVVSPLPADTQPMATPSSDGLAQISISPTGLSHLLYQLQTSLGELIYNVGTFSQAAIANLKVGIVETTELIAQVGQVRQIRLETISPLATDSAGIAVELGPNQTFGIYDQEGTPAATFDALGNATFSGELSARTLHLEGERNSLHLPGEATGEAALDVAGDATISGTLYADRVVTSFGNLNEKLASLEASRGGEEGLPGASESASFASELAQAVSVSEGDLVVNTDLFVLGDTALGATSITGSLLVDGAIHFTQNVIETIGETLYIQKTKLANVDILDGTLLVDIWNRVFVRGDLSISGNTQVEGVLGTATLSPLTGGDLTIDLSYGAQGVGNLTLPPLSLRGGEEGLSGEATPSGFGRLLVRGVNQEIVAAIDASGSAAFRGDIVASGSGTFKKLNLTVTNHLEGESNSSHLPGEKDATAGTATLPAGETSAIVVSTALTEHSLIYITPITSTNNRVIYLRTKNAGVGFTVGIDQPPETDIQFNWWVIN